MKCSECGSEQLIRDYETSEVVCMGCGFVLDEKIADMGPEWRAFDLEQREKRTRVGAPVTFTIHDKGLSTKIGAGNRAVGSSPEKRAQIYRLRKWQRRIQISDAKERNLMFALSHLNKVCSSMNLPRPILDTASIIYRKALKKRIVRGRSIHSVVSAAVYMSCRKCGIARTLNEVANASNMDRKKLGKAYRYLVKELNEFIPQLASSFYVSRLTNHLNLSGEAEIVGVKIIRAAKEMRLTSGRGPLGMAAAATYLASVIIADRRTQREVAEAAGVTEVTIRNRYKELINLLEVTMKL
jgi:transcription initiation factor TFIIB